VFCVLGWLGVVFDLLGAMSFAISVISLTFIGSAGGPEGQGKLKK
jgi:hypothetical protein